VAFVVEIPQGRTAHQAKDGRYYGRSEFENRPLRDFDIRLRMERGKTPLADLVVEVRPARSADDVHKELIEEHRKDLTELSKYVAPDPAQVPDEIAVMDRTLRALGADRPHLIDSASIGQHRVRCHEYEVSFLLRNAGGRTIREFEVRVAAEAAEGCGIAEAPSSRQPIGPQPTGGFFGPEDVMRLRQLSLSATERDCAKEMTNGKLWPGATCTVARATLFVPGGRAPCHVAVADWTVFLDEVLPRAGRIEFASDEEGRLTLECT